jgi:hypothetical protein
MSPWTHRYVMSNEAVLEVAPTPTTVLATSVEDHSAISGIISNLDLTQSVAVAWSSSWDGVDRWAGLDALNATQFIEPLAPGESRHFEFDCRNLRYVRMQCSASGAGCEIVLSAQRIISLGVR